MADARSLLKAKRLERGTAAVPTRGGLRAKEDERLLRKGKRKLENTNAVLPASSSVVEPPSDKRRKIEAMELETVSTPPPPADNGFPADFFSDPSRKLPTADGDDEYDNEEDEDQQSSNVAPPSLPFPSQSQPKLPQPITANKALPSIDDEFAAFERAIQTASRPKRDTNLEAYSQATVSAEAELVSEVPDGFPPSVLERQREGGGDAGPSSGSANAADAAAAPEEDETEIDQRRRKEEEERELIMDRLVDEERAQEEADAKVTALKARLEAIKLKRAAKKAGS